MRVFISYRRSDSKDVAARIADNLSQVREIESVFLDVDSIAHGENFPDRLEAEIKRADALIAVIGPGWKGAQLEDGRSRIESNADFVRKEIAKGLELGKRIIPCLVNDAQMPDPVELPADIAQLAQRNACTIRHTSFRIDFEILCEAILQRRRGAERSGLSIAMGALARGLAGLVIAAFVAVAIASLGMSSLGLPLETILGGRVALVLFLVVLFGLFQAGTYRFIKRNT